MRGNQAKELTRFSDKWLIKPKRDKIARERENCQSFYDK